MYNNVFLFYINNMILNLSMYFFLTKGKKGEIGDLGTKGTTGELVNYITTGAHYPDPPSALFP